jgi:serine/threonine-protein kinase
LLRPGDRIDHYTLLSPLGEGGQATVWKVLDPRDGGVVRALKLIALAETGSAAFDRARREARILAAAKHPALVTCHGLFEDPHAGLVGLVMDLVPGGSLAEAADAGRLDRAQSLAVVAQLAEVLAYIHGAGLAHRDLKPENVLLTEGFWEGTARPGTVKLVDFGIAATTGAATKLTAPGMVIGTLPYLAPELVDPATWGRGNGPARDVFALGVLGCRLLLDRHPTGLRFDAAIIDFARAYKAAQAGRIAWPPPGLERTWGATLAACLALRPEDRPADGAAVLAMLRATPSTRRGAAGDVSGPTSTHHPPRVVVTESMAASAATPPPAIRTEPMRAPAHQPRTIPAAPLASVPAARSKAPVGSRRRSSAARGLAVPVFLGSCAAVVVVAGYEVGFGGSAPAPPATAVTAPASAPPPLPAPVAIADVRDAGACCPPDASCTGPTTFPREQCSRRCGKPVPLLPRFAWWQLRVIQATLGVGGMSILDDHPNAELEMKVGTSTQVLRFSQIGKDGAANSRLAVRTEDVENGRVHIRLTDGDTTLADGPGRVRARPVGASALCAGLYVYLDTPDGETIVLSVYLDP